MISMTVRCRRVLTLVLLVLVRHCWHRMPGAALVSVLMVNGKIPTIVPVSKTTSQIAKSNKTQTFVPVVKPALPKL